MADARYIIDIILNARDNTAAAFAKASGQAEAFKRIQEETERQNKRTADSWEQMSRRMNTSQAEFNRQMERARQGSKAQLDQTVALEQATRNYIKAQGDANQSDAQRLQALNRLREAEDKLTKTLQEQGDQDARRTAQAVTNSVRRQEQAKAEAATYAQAQQQQARDEAEALRKRKAAQDEYLAKARQNLRAIENDRKDADAAQAQRDREAARRQEEYLARARRNLQAIENDRRDAAEAQRRDDEEAARRQEEFLARARRNLQAIENDRRDAEDEQKRRDLEAAERQRDFLEQARRNLQLQQNERREAEASRQRELNLQRQYVNELQKITRLENERREATRRGDTLAVARIDLDDADAKAKAAALAAELKAIFGRIAANVDMDTSAAKAHAAEMLALKAALGTDVNFDVDVDVGNALAKLAAVEAASKRMNNELGLMRGLLRSVSEGFHNSSGTISSFDNFLRGLMSLGIAVFFNQLFLLAGAAAGAFSALASSAAMAGGALAGSLVAGIAQALGPLGILITFAMRLKAVMDAVSQANLLDQQQAGQAADLARRRAGAVDQVRGAEERLADANRRVRQAQDEVNDARQEGIDKLKELILAEQGLSLSLDEQQTAIRRAASRGDTAALPRAFLQRRETQAELTGVRQEIAERQQAGPNRSPELLQAQEGLRDAQRSARDAQRSLDAAKRSAQDAEEGVTSAGAKLNYLLGQLSGAERRLYDAILRLQTVWREFSQEATEPLINAMTYAVGRVTELLLDPKIRAAARRMAETMAQEFRRIFDAFTSDQAVGQMLRIIEQARRNLRPLTDIAINIGKAFMDIAEAAGPAFRQIIDWVREISEKITDFFESGRKSGDLQKFFTDGVVHLKAWGDLLWAVVRLFAAIAGPGGGAKTGLQIVRDMGDAIRDWAEAIRTPGTKLNEFFNRFHKLSKDMLEALGIVFSSIAREIDKTFNEDGLHSVEGFATFLADVLVPAVGDFARFLGRATAALGEFAREHPNVTRLVSAIVAGSLAVSVFGRALAILGPIMRPLGFLAGQFANMTGLTARLALMGERLIGIFIRLRPVILGPWGLAAAAILFLLQRAGKLDDIWRALVDTAKEFWKQIQPGIEDLTESLKTLWDQFDEGGGLVSVILDILTVLASLIGDVLIEAIKSLGILLQNVFRGVFRVFGGVIDIISAIIALLRGDFDEAGRLALRGIRKVAQGIWDALWGVLSGIGGFFVRLFKRAISAVLEFLGIASPSKKFMEIGKDILDGLWEGIKGIGGFLVRGFRSGINQLSDWIHGAGAALEDFGLRIIKAIARGIVNGAGAVKDAVKGTLDKIPDITPWKGLTPFAAGGPIPAPAGVGFPILAHGGEHMLTASEVNAAGGHGAIFALRRMLGGGGQGGGGRGYAAGGAIPAAGAGPQVGVTFAGNLDQFKDSWGEMWKSAVDVSRRSANLIEEQFDQMRVNSTATLKRLYNDAKDYIAAIQNSVESRGKNMVSSWADSMNSMSDVTYKGLKYIGDQMGKALKALGGKSVDLNLSTPKKSNVGGASTSTDRAPGGRFASGGVVGQWGERGQDAVPTWLGRGEVVLNWAQQMAANAAMSGRSSLRNIVERTRGFHAGGFGAPGLATGGGDIFNGHPSNVNTAVLALIKLLQSKFPLIVTSTTDHSRLTTSGNVSDHTVGAAVDLAANPGIMLRAAEYIKNSGLYKKLKQGIHNPNLAVNNGQLQEPPGQFAGAVWAQHANHLHLAIVGALRGAFTDATTEIKKVTVEGTGALKGVAQGALDMVRKAGNAMLAQAAALTTPGDQDYGPLKGSAAGEQIFRFFKRAGFSDEQAAAWVGNFVQESGLDPSVIQPNGEGHGLAQWGGGRFDALQAFAASKRKPWTDMRTQLEFVMHELNGSESAAYSAIKASTTLDQAVNAIGTKYERYGIQGDRSGPAREALATYGGEFATGGPVPGGEGRPVTILAHAGEWVLNRMQQSKVAGWLGVSSGALKNALGFGGSGKSAFADGGEVTNLQRRLSGIRRGVYAFPDVDPSTIDAINTEISRVYRAIQNISKKGGLGKTIDRFMKNIRAMTDEGGYLDQMGEAIENLGDRLSSGLELAQVGFRRVGNRLRRRTGGPLVDAVEIADRTVSMYEEIGKAISAGRADAVSGLNQTNRQIAQLRKGGITKKETERYQQLMAARQRFTDAIDGYDQQFIENQQNIWEATQDRFKAQTDAAMRGANDRASTLDMQQRIATAFGQEGVVASIGAQQLEVLRQQQAILQSRLNEASALAARDPRWQAIADELMEQLRNTTVSIAEAQANSLKAQIDASNRQFTNDQRLEGLSDRMLNVRERLGGDRLQLNWDRQVLSASRVNSMEQQRARLQALIPQTFATGDQGAFTTLIEQIEDLSVAIAEENATRRELVYQYRQTATDLIQGRIERSTGLIGTAQGIIRQVGGLQGNNLDIGKLRSLFQQTIDQLRSAAGQIATNVRQAAHEFSNPQSGSVLQQLANAFQQGPSTFASTLAALGPTIAALESTMGEAERTTFQGLIQSMIDNTTATLDNTTQLEDLNGQQTQSFASTAWQWFREAIFNGMGQVLPQYGVPQMATGGSVTRGGLFELHTGEFVVNAEGSNIPSGDNISIEINEAGQPIDVQHLVSRLAFEKKSKGR